MVKSVKLDRLWRTYAMAFTMTKNHNDKRSQGYKNILSLRNMAYNDYKVNGGKRSKLK